jgi:hypothetical protein
VLFSYAIDAASLGHLGNRRYGVTTPDRKIQLRILD